MWRVQCGEWRVEGAVRSVELRALSVHGVNEVSGHCSSFYRDRLHVTHDTSHITRHTAHDRIDMTHNVTRSMTHNKKHNMKHNTRWKEKTQNSAVIAVYVRD